MTDSTAENFVNSASNSFWINNGIPAEQQRTIVMTGMARTGTSFVASVFGHLGVPMRLHDRDKVSGHWEHIAMREALVEEDHETLDRLFSEFNAKYDTWAWKAPAIRLELEMLEKKLRNPCFVFVFKEPLSVAMRKIDRGAKADVARHFKRIFESYMGMVQFAQETSRPCMLVSFDRAVKKGAATVKAFAEFAGVQEYDVEKVLAGVKQDEQNYVKVGG
jgi:hypothetical protein